MERRFEMFNRGLEIKYGKCEKCGAKMEHDKGIHTFECPCGNRKWYGERLGDYDESEIIKLGVDG